MKMLTNLVSTEMVAGQNFINSVILQRKQKKKHNVILILANQSINIRNIMRVKVKGFSSIRFFEVTIRSLYCLLETI